MEPVFSKARTQFHRYLRKVGLTHLPDDVVERIVQEGAANAVRAANGQLKPSFMSTRMRWELGRWWRTPEGQALARTMELTDELVRQELWKKRGQAGDGALETRNEAERLWADTTEIEERQQRTIFTRQPSVLKKRLLYATTSTRKNGRLASPRWLSNQVGKPTRQVNRLIKTAQGDLEYTARTGKIRDRKIKSALTCIPDERHREALYLHLTQGMSTRQLASRYGVSHTAIAKWINASKELLATHAPTLLKIA